MLRAMEDASTTHLSLALRIQQSDFTCNDSDAFATELWLKHPDLFKRTELCPLFTQRPQVKYTPNNLFVFVINTHGFFAQCYTDEENVVARFTALVITLTKRFYTADPITLEHYLYAPSLQLSAEKCLKSLISNRQATIQNSATRISDIKVPSSSIFEPKIRAVLHFNLASPYGSPREHTDTDHDSITHSTSDDDLHPAFQQELAHLKTSTSDSSQTEDDPSPRTPGRHTARIFQCDQIDDQPSGDHLTTLHFQADSSRELNKVRKEPAPNKRSGHPIFQNLTSPGRQSPKATTSTSPMRANSRLPFKRSSLQNVTNESCLACSPRTGLQQQRTAEIMAHAFFQVRQGSPRSDIILLTIRGWARIHEYKVQLLDNGIIVMLSNHQQIRLINNELQADSLDRETAGSLIALLRRLPTLQEVSLKLPSQHPKLVEFFEHGMGQAPHLTLTPRK